MSPDEISQIPLGPAVKETGRPEVAVAAAAKSESPYVLLAIALRLSSCTAFSTVKVIGEDSRATKLALSARVAITVQEPASKPVSTDPLTLQFPPLEVIV